MKIFSFLEKGKLKDEKRGIIIFSTSVFSMLFFWILFTINTVFEGFNKNFLLFGIIISAMLFACLIYGIKLAMTGKKWKRR